MTDPTHPSQPEHPVMSRFGGGAVKVGIGILSSRVFGLVRTRFQGQFLGGDTVAADAFTLALRLPNFLQNLLGEGALSASFIPPYSRLVATGDTERARKLASAVFSALAAVVAVIVLGGMLVAPFVVALFTPSWDSEARELAVLLVRIVFPGTGLLVLSAWCLAILNSHGRFLLPYTAPVFWNIAIIGFLIYGGMTDAGQSGLALYAAAGALVGSLLQLLVQLPAVVRVNGVPGLRRGLMSDDFRGVVRRFIPSVAARGSVQISAYVDTILVNLLGTTGGLAVLGYAQTLYQLPISLFGMSVSAAELPGVSAASGDGGALTPEARAVLRERLDRTLRRALYFAIPSAVAMLAVGGSMVSLLWEGGSFSGEDVQNVRVVLLGFALGVVPAVAAKVVATSFFAMRDTRTPLHFALTRIVVATALAVPLLFALPGLLSPEFLAERSLWRVAGLSVAGSIGYWLEFALLFSAVEQRVGRLGGSGSYYLKLLVAGAAAAAGALALVHFRPIPVGPLLNVVVLASFGATYIICAYAMGVRMRLWPFGKGRTGQRSQ